MEIQTLKLKASQTFDGKLKEHVEEQINSLHLKRKQLLHYVVIEV